MKNYIVEFIGTFFLVLVVGLAAGAGGAGAMAPVAIGVTLMVMVYMGGHISGAHYNPAVTLGVWMRGKMNMSEAIVYMIVQIVAGVAAAACAMYLAGDGFGRPAVAESADAVKALVVEFLFTFALVSVVLQTATNPKTSGNSYYGLAIGFTVLAAAYAGGGISGGAFNPAVGLGGNIVASSLSDVWIYLVGPFAGGALAAVVYKVVSGDDD